jgi:hypothetical protein
LLLRENTDPSKGPPRLAHLYAREYLSCGHVSPEEFDAFFKFAVVRNPWARAVSAYKYMTEGRLVPFAAFVRDLGLRVGDSAQARQLDPQATYVRSVDRVLIVDRVLRFENLSAEFAEVGRKIFGREEPLPVTNVSRDRRDYRTFYNDATAEIVARAYADDIASFGYKFDDAA